MRETRMMLLRVDGHGHGVSDLEGILEVFFLKGGM